MEVMDELTNPNVRDELIDIASSIEDYNKYVDKFIKSNKITKHQYKVFLNSPDFKKLMQKHGGDFYKAMKSQTAREVLRTFLWQSGLMTVIQGSLWGYNTAKENRLEQDAAKGNIASIVKLAGFDWDVTKKIFESSGSIEDNELLKKAWNEGWTPWGINYETGKAEKEPSESDVQFAKEWLKRHPEYQTNTFKENHKIDMSKVSGVEIGGEDVDEEKFETYKSEYETKVESVNQEEYDEIIINYNKQKDTIQGNNDLDKFLNYLENTKM